MTNTRYRQDDAPPAGGQSILPCPPPRDDTPPYAPLADADFEAASLRHFASCQPPTLDESGCQLADISFATSASMPRVSSGLR